MRGLPGSGKSTKAEKLQPDKHLRPSADDFFVGSDGVYRYTPAKIGNAHKYCQAKAETLMKIGQTPVVIDNTNIKKKDFQIYLDFAAKYGYDVKYETSDAPWAWDVDTCAVKNTHGVPKDVIQRMKDNFQK